MGQGHEWGYSVEECPSSPTHLGQTTPIFKLCFHFSSQLHTCKVSDQFILHKCARICQQTDTREGDVRIIQLVPICILTTRIHKLLHTCSFTHSCSLFKGWGSTEFACSPGAVASRYGSTLASYH